MLAGKITHELLKEIVDVTGTIREDVKLDFDESGLTIRAVDPSHIAMVEIKIPKQEFASLELSSNVSCGLDLKKIKDMLKLGKHDDIIDFKMETDRNAFNISFNKIKRTLPLIDEKTFTDTKAPSLKFMSNVTLGSKDFLDGVKAASSVSRHVSVMLTSGGLEIAAKEDIDTVSYSIPKEALAEINCPQDTESTYSLDYLTKMIQVIPSDKLTIHLTNEYPLMLEFAVGKEGGVKYLLAPKVRE